MKNSHRSAFAIAQTVGVALAGTLLGMSVFVNNAHGDSHGGANSSCIECHGHDAGTPYDPDASSPYTAGATASQGRGTYISHSTHTETDSDDLNGPGIYCDSCHDINNFPYFKSGVDSNGDGNVDLAETDICNDCHSPGGSYDGITLAVAGWAAGVYWPDDCLIPGQENWCIACHDGEPASSSGVSAPSVSLFHESGHGRPGADLICLDCHDPTSKHIDGEARTYSFDAADYGPLQSGVSYAAGDRLRFVQR
jgi:hypothetical protein